jgi:hypothetical protein
MTQTYKILFICIIFAHAIIYFVQYQFHIGNDYKYEKFNFEKYVDVIQEPVKSTTPPFLILPSSLLI